MSVREPAKQQPKDFEFSSENMKKVRKIIANYPQGRQASAVMPLLDIAQRQNGGWIPVLAMDKIAQILEMPYIKVYEVASFYTMYNLKPVGENLIQLCRTTPCWLRGSDKIREACEKKLGIGLGETTSDKKFTLVEVECIGACVNAPAIQINDDYYEDLSPEQTDKILDSLKKGKKLPIGTQVKRINSAPVGGATTLNAKKKVDKNA